MAGTTPHGIRYPDGASKAKNLGPELKTMAEDIDKVFTDTSSSGIWRDIVEDVAEDVVPPLVEEYLDDNPRLPEMGDPRKFRVIDEAGAVAFEINERGEAMIGDGVESRRSAMRIMDADGQVAFEVTATGDVRAYGGGLGGGGGEGTTVNRCRMRIIGGQSLASGRALPMISGVDDLGHPALWQVGHKSRNLRLATPLLDMQDDPTGLAPGWFAGLEAARTAAPGEVIILIPAAMGGTGLVWTGSTRGCWDPTYNGPNRHLYAEMLQQITDAIRLTTERFPGASLVWEALDWNQGESDAVNGVTQAQWATKFDALANGVRTHLGVDIPIVLGQSVREWMATESGAAGIQRAQIDSLGRLQRTAYAYMPPNAGNYGDVLHANRQAIEQLGLGMLAARTEACANVDGTGPLPVPGLTATVAGGTLSVAWERPLCRVTDYRVQYRVGAGGWSTIARSSALHREASTAVGSGTVQVRITTINGTGESAPTTAITAIGA